MEREGFEPPNPKERIYSPPRLTSSLPFQTKKNQGDCMINWLCKRKGDFTLEVTLEWKGQELNLSPSVLQTDALPTELPVLNIVVCNQLKRVLKSFASFEPNLEPLSTQHPFYYHLFKISQKEATLYQRYPNPIYSNSGEKLITSSSFSS